MNRSARILIVDDDARLLEGLARLLRASKLPWDVVTAASGRDAARLASEGAFDVLVTDMLMPEPDGIETMRAIRTVSPETRIIAMSGGGDMVGMEPLHCARLLGADVALEKPFSFEALLEAIRELMS